MGTHRARERVSGHARGAAIRVAVEAGESASRCRRAPEASLSSPADSFGV